MNDNTEVDWIQIGAGLFVLAVGWLVIYGSAAFIALSPFPTEWSTFLRVVYVLITLGYTVALVDAAFD